MFKNSKRSLQVLIGMKYYKEKDTEIAYEKFMNKFRPILDRHAPLRKRRVKQNNEIPWLNKDVKDNDET